MNTRPPLFQYGTNGLRQAVVIVRGRRGDVHLAAQLLLLGGGIQRDTDSFGVLKSMACGLKVIASKITEVASVEAGSVRMVFTSIPTCLP